jgi:hypothetical protein
MSKHPSPTENGVTGERNLHRRHSTLPIERFVGLLHAYCIETLYGHPHCAAFAS